MVGLALVHRRKAAEWVVSASVELLQQGVVWLNPVGETQFFHLAEFCFKFGICSDFKELK